MLITRLRWKLRRLAIRLEGQINSWENIEANKLCKDVSSFC